MQILPGNGETLSTYCDTQDNPMSERLLWAHGTPAVLRTTPGPGLQQVNRVGWVRSAAASDGIAHSSSSIVGLKSEFSILELYSNFFKIKYTVCAVHDTQRFP